MFDGCLAPKPVCLDNCRRSRDTQPSIKSDRAASCSSRIVYEISHFHSKFSSKLVLDLTDTSHFILLILSLHLLVRLLSSSLILLKWNWETQVGLFSLNKIITFVFLGVESFSKHVSSLFLVVLSEGGKKIGGWEWQLPHVCLIILFNGHKKRCLKIIFAASIFSRVWTSPLYQ